jgi:putative selenate reductase
MVEAGKLRLRQDGKVFELAIDSAGTVKDAPPELVDMCRIASRVVSHHGYLLSAVEE